MKLITTRRRGMATLFVYRCTRCHKKIKCPSHNKKQASELNKGIVWGSVNIGIGHHQTQEMFSLMGVETLSDKTYRKIEEEIYDVSAFINFLFFFYIFCITSSYNKKIMLNYAYYMF